MRPRSPTLRLSALCLGLTLGCEPGSEDGGLELVGQCPPAVPRWDDFGQTFMNTYCVRCHDSRLSGSERQGAPSDHNFDTVIGVRSELAHIHRQAGGGQGFVNTNMPPDGLLPSAEERQRLTEWLLCAAP